MTKLALDPKVTCVPGASPSSPRETSQEPQNTPEKSTFTTTGPNRWKAMTESTDTPSVIGDMLESTETITDEPTARDVEQAYLGDLMCGDWGKVRVSDNKHINIEDHEEILIPDVKDLFAQYPELQDNTFPLLERLTLLQKAIQSMIEANTSALKQGGMTTDEIQGTKDYVNYLYDCMHEVQRQLDLIDFYRQNELYRRKEALEELED